MKRTSPIWITLLLAGLLFIAGCSDSRSDPKVATETPSPTSTATVSPSATATPEPLPESLQRVLDRVAEVRELDAPPALKVEFVARSGVVDLLDQLTTNADREWFAKLTDLYQLLGHLRNDQTYLDIYRSFGGDAVLGLYSPPHDTLWVVHKDGEAPSIDSLSKPLEETLAHEFVHALQDYHFDLVAADDTFEDNLDITQAWTAVIEGDAVTNEQMYSQRYLALPSGGVIVTSASAQIPDVPPSIIRELYFPYTTGADWIRAARQERGATQIDAWLQEPPAGTAYILHPELIENGFEPANVTLPDLAGALGKDFERTWSSTLGEFNLRNYLQLQARASDSVAAATGWAGDHFDIYKNGDEAVAVFRVHFADDAEAEEFERIYRGFLERASGDTEDEGGVTYTTLRDGDVVALAPRQDADVLFAIGSSRELTSRAITALLRG